MSWRRILLLSIALVSTLSVATWALLQNSDFATDFVRRALREAFVTEVQLAGTTVHVQAGRLEIEGLEVADPTAQGRALLRVERGHVDASFTPDAGALTARSVVLDGVHLEAGPLLPSLSQVLRAGDPSAPAGERPSLPAVELRSGTATLHLREGQPPLVFDRFEVSATPLDGEPHILQVRGALHLAAPAAAMKLEGQVDVATGAARFALETAGVACTPEIAARFARLADVDEPALDVGGHVDSLRLLCTLAAAPQSAPPAPPRFELDVRCSAVHVRAPALPSVVRSADLRLFVDTSQQGGLLQADISQRDEGGDVTLRARLTQLGAAERLGVTIDAKGRDVVVDQDVLAALRTFPIGRNVVAALKPTSGRADIDFYIKDPHRPSVETEMDLHLRDFRMSYAGFGEDEQRVGFPLPLEHGSGTVRLRGRALLLQEVRASIPDTAGGGDVTLEGRITFPRGAATRTSLDIRGRRVAFRADLRDALAALLRDEGALYDRLAPSGSADVHVRVRPRDELPGGFDVEIQPRGAAMRWEGFPYALTDLQGRIEVRGADARFDLSGRHGEGELSMQGRIPLQQRGPSAGGFEAVVELDKLTIDEELRAGVAVVVPELDQQWRGAAPTGRLSGTVKVWRPRPEDDLHHDVQLMLDGVDLALPLAPWRAEQLQGQVLVQGAGPSARIDFDALRGTLTNGSTAPAQLALLGHLESGARVVRDLAFVVRDLQLDEQLGQTLEALGALELETWRSLAPSGRVDLVVRERAAPDAAPDVRVVVQLADVRSDARMLPRAAENMTGELHIGGGQLTFRDVRGRLGDATVHCTNGRVRQLGDGDGRTEISFDVHAKDFPVDGGLANLFSGPLHESILQRHLRGRADVDGLRLQFLVPATSSTQPFSTRIGGAVGLDGVDVTLGTGRDGIRLVDLRGVVVLADSIVTETGGQLVGTLSRSSLSLFGHQLEAAEMTFTADAEQLTIPTLKARLHEGELRHAVSERPAVRYLLPGAKAPDGRLSTELQFARIDVFSLLSASGWQNSPYKGLASGELRLDRLDGNQVVGAVASGRLSLERADLGKVPLFKAIYAQLPAADQPRFNELDVSFELDEQRVRFEQLEIRSELLAATGAGALDLDGYLDVKMKLDNLLGQSADPLVMPLIDYLAKNLVSFRLFGHLRDLQASTDFLRARTPQRQPVLPIPPARTPPRGAGY